MWRRSLFGLILASLASNMPVHSLSVQWDPDTGGPILTHQQRVVFRCSPVAAFANGEWASQKQGDLVKTDSRSFRGTDPILGAYSAIQVSWTVGPSKTKLVTATKSFDDGLTVTFSQSWPDGADGTSLVRHNSSGMRSYNEVLANFPAIVNSSLPNTLSWAGSFVEAQLNRGTEVCSPQHPQTNAATRTLLSRCTPATCTPAPLHAFRVVLRMCCPSRVARRLLCCKFHPRRWLGRREARRCSSMQTTTPFPSSSC